jgi:hypothetical protein
VTYSYFADPMYVFMDADYNQYEVEAENMVDALKYLEDGLQCEVVFYNGKAISVELPNSVVREVIYTEPAVKGDTSGKVMKPAKLATGFELPVPAFVEHRRQDRNRHPHRRIQEPRQVSAVFARFESGSFGCPICISGGQFARWSPALPIRGKSAMFPDPPPRFRGQQCFDAFAALPHRFPAAIRQHLGRRHPAHCKRAACRSRRDRPHRPVEHAADDPGAGHRQDHR